MAAVGRTELVDFTGDEGVHGGEFGFAEGVELADFDDPDAGGLQGGVIGLEVLDLVGIPVAPQDVEGGGFAAALTALQDEHAVGLAAGGEGAGDGGDEPFAADSLGVEVVWGSAVRREPGREAVDAVPL